MVCNGGNPLGLTAEEAHKGVPEGASGTGPKTFYPDPGNIWIADNSCGQAGCHQGYPYRMECSLMNTEAGKIQGNLHTWGVEEVQNHKAPWGNYAVEDTDGLEPTVGTDAYKAYMANLIKEHPDQMPTKLDQIPLPSVDEIEADPKLAGFTYQRQQCQRCLWQRQGRQAACRHRLDRRRQREDDGRRDPERPDRRVPAGHPRLQEPGQGLRETLLSALGGACAGYQRRGPRDPADAGLPDRLHRHRA